MGEAPFEIDAVGLDRLQRGDAPPAILDVREPWELTLCRFEGSLDIPLATLPGRIDELPRDRMVVVVCHHGMRSLRAVSWLRAQGMDNAVNLSGGIDGWAREIDTAMRTY
jgi:rhodanese-related sulfurtransferase